VTFFLFLFPDKIVLEGEGFGTKRRFYHGGHAAK
jgi:hypothetical protein